MKLNRSTQTTILVSFLLLVVVSIASAADYYVSTTGNNANPGTLSQPWATPSYAATKAVAGDTIYLLDGTWNDEHVVFANSGTQTAPIILKAYNGTPTLDGVDQTGVAVETNDKSYIEISGLRITNYNRAFYVTANAASAYNITVRGNIIENTASDAIKLAALGAESPPYLYNLVIADNAILNSAQSGTGDGMGSINIAVDGVHDSIIKNNTIKNSPAGAIIAYWLSNNIIEGNKIDNTGRAISGYQAYDNIIKNNVLTNINDRGIRIDMFSTGNQIINNTLKNVAGSGLNLYEDSSSVIKGNYFEKTSLYSVGIKDTLFENNIFNCGNSVYVLLDSGGHENRNVTFKNNVFVDCMSIDLRNMSNSIIKNSIFLNSPLKYSASSGTNTVSYNDFWNSAVSGITPIDSINQDPLFANPSAGDFHLKSQAGRWNGITWVADPVTSPAIDAGDPLDDYSLEPVPNGDRINIGAFGNTQEASKSTGITITVPLSPQNLQAAIADKQVTLFWQAPVYDGGTVITNYNIYRNGALIATLGNLLTYIDTGLTNDIPYVYEVSALNAIGEGVKSNQVSATPSLSTTVILYPTADTAIKSGEPDLVRSSKTWIDLGRLSGGGNYRGLLYFDLSTIPSSSIINSATLTLVWEGENRNQPTTISVYRPSSVWDNTATWNSRQTGVSWTTAGGDWLDKNSVSYGTTPYSEVTYPLGSTLDANLNLTSLVQEYVSAKYPNTGFFLKANEVDNTYISFYSSEAIVNQPNLSITYSTASTLNTDINQDGAIDISDLRIVALHFGETTSPPYPRYDVNADATVDILDLRQVAGGM